MRKHREELIRDLRTQPWAKPCSEDSAFWNGLTAWISDVLLPDFLSLISSQIDEIVDISPDLSEQDILAEAAQYISDFLEARSASVRIYDPVTAHMLSYGSYPPHEENRPRYIALDHTVAGDVVKTLQTFLVPDIQEEELFKGKSTTLKKGIHSLMAVPLKIPRFYPTERDTVGVIQVYFPEKNRNFSPLEIQAAEVMARRLSFAIVRKKILSMQRVNEKKEKIVRRIFTKMGSGHGIKMKDVFNRIIPELADIVSIQSCALFSVTEDNENVVLEAGYPDLVGYHGIGKTFPVSAEPAFELILGQRPLSPASPYEVMTQPYLLVMDPHRSQLVSDRVKAFAAANNINSILYIPLNVGEDITHFMTFDALDQRQRYTEEEVEILLFLGRELMKAQRMEQLDDILHDFKNPSIATAGFARRLKRLLDEEQLEKNGRTIRRYVDILLDETSRLQEMTLSLYHIGEEQFVNLTEVLQKRFEINREAIREQLKQNVELHRGPFEDPLPVRCYPLHLERILDNLLNNATNAIPLQGGILAIRTYTEGDWACAEITNTGLISNEEYLKLLEGEGRGRGLYITHRIIRLLRGKIDIKVGKNTTTLMVRLPRHGEAPQPH